MTVSIFNSNSHKDDKSSFNANGDINRQRTQTTVNRDLNAQTSARTHG